MNKSGLMASLSSSLGTFVLFSMISMTDVLDENIPVIEKRVKKQVQPPWMSNDSKEAMKERDKHLNQRLPEPAHG